MHYTLHAHPYMCMTGSHITVSLRLATSVSPCALLGQNWQEHLDAMLQHVINQITNDLPADVVPMSQNQQVPAVIVD